MGQRTDAEADDERPWAHRQEPPVQRRYLFQIGLNRAGTTSLCRALEILGIPSVHWRHRDERLVDIIRANRRQGLPLLAGLDQQFQAFADFAGQFFFRELDACYPGSRFILTTRALDSWIDSRVRKVARNRANPAYRHGFRSVDVERWRQEYTALHRDACAHFAGRPQDFLILDIPAGDGWGSLCPFLGLPQPAVPFPHLNALPQSAPETTP